MVPGTTLMHCRTVPLIHENSKQKTFVHAYIIYSGGLTVKTCYGNTSNYEWDKKQLMRFSWRTHANLIWPNRRYPLNFVVIIYVLAAGDWATPSPPSSPSPTSSGSMSSSTTAASGSIPFSRLVTVLRIRDVYPGFRVLLFPSRIQG